MGCGQCAKACPTEAITVGKDTVTVSTACIGCGLCAAACPKKAIDMVQTAPQEERLDDYYWGFRPEI